MTYHQLGMIAEERRDFDQAENWYRKSLAIEEKQGNEHGAAITHGQLGILAGSQGRYRDCGQWLIRCIQTFATCNDRARAEGNTRNFAIFYSKASQAQQAELREMWRKAGLGEYPQADGTSGE